MSDDDRKVYIGGLPFRYTKEDLYDMFEKYGAIEDAFIIRERESGKSRGFGFVIYQSRESIEDAISGLNDTELDGRHLIVEKAGRRSRGGGGGGGGNYRRGGGGYRGGGGGGNYRNRDRDYGGRGSYGDDRRYGGGGRRDYDRY